MYVYYNTSCLPHSFRKCVGKQRKVVKEMRDMFNASAIIDIDSLTKVLIVSNNRLSNILNVYLT